MPAAGVGGFWKRVGGNLDVRGKIRIGGTGLGNTDNSAEIIVGAGTPTDGTSGTGVAAANPGSLYIDKSGAVLYQNTGTKASPVWTAPPLASVTANTLGVTRISRYTYRTSLGTAGTVTLTGTALPNKAMVFNSFMNVGTALTTGGTAGIQLLTAGDIIAGAATSGEPWSTAEPEIGVCVAATEATWLTTTNGTTKPAIVLTGAGMAAGEFNLWLEYVVTD